MHLGAVENSKDPAAAWEQVVNRKEGRSVGQLTKRRAVGGVARGEGSE